MKTHHIICRICSVLILCYTCCPGLYAASSLLPTGTEVVERCIKASGGREEMLKVQNSLTKGTVEIKTLGLRGTFTVYRARPNKIRAQFDIEGLGVMERGFDGEVYWDKNVSTGARILQGPERQINVLLAYFDATYYDQIYREIRCDGVEEVEGQPCYKVALVPEGCDPITDYYAKDTSLPLREELTIQRLYHQDRLVNTVKEYKTINGLFMPYLNIEQLGGTLTYRRTDSIELNVALPEGIFDLPKDVKALLDQENVPDESSSQTHHVD